MFKIALRTLQISLLLMFSVSENISSAAVLGGKNEIDSIGKLVSACKTDSGKVVILGNIFRKHMDKDFVRARYYGEWIFRDFKNSASKYSVRVAYYNKGELLRTDEKYDSAILCYQRAMELSDDILKGQCYYRIAKSYDGLGEQKRAIDNLKIANTYFTKVNSSKNIHKTYDLIIAIFARKGEYDSAIVYIEKKLSLDRLKDNPVKEMEDHVYAATLYGQQNKFNLAFDHLVVALRIAETSNIPLVDIYGSIAKLFYQKKNFRMAIEYYNKALESCKNAKEDVIQSEMYNNLGRTYLDEKQYENAYSNILKAFAVARRLNNRQHLANTYRNLGHYYQCVKKPDSAMFFLQLSYNVGRTLGAQLDFFDVVVDVADLYLKKQNFEKANAWYMKASDLAEKFSSKRDLALSKFKMGSFYQSRGQYGQAEVCFLQSISFARESKQPTIEKDIAETLSQFYEFKGDFKQAHKYLNVSKILADSISKMDGKANVAALEMKFEFENLKNENEAKQSFAAEEIKRQKIYRNFLFIISGLLVFIGGILFVSYRKKKNDNNLLKLQKTQIEEKNQEILAQVEEIRSQKDEIQRISAKLHETDQLKLRFFSNISHEIRTPLTLIINPLKTFKDSFEGSDEQARQLELIYGNASRLSELTNQILDIQKLDSGKLSLNIQNADIVAHLKGLVSSFEGFCNTANCKLSFESQYSSVYCLFDKDKLSKITSNLLSNAFKYNKVGGEVVVQVSFRDTSICILIRDNGQGIPKEYQSDIFTRYYQLEHSNNRHEGTGIGLAYVKELIDLMKGAIELESELNVGTSFRIVIPIAEPKIENSQTVHQHFKPIKSMVSAKPDFEELASESDDASTQTILIVEDNLELRNLIGNIFSADFRVIYAPNGRDGLEKALQFVPDIIISDIMMPLMNGLEMCTQLKQNAQTCHIPIVLLTAKDSLENQVVGYQSGADDYIVKPFDSTLLKLKVQNNIETREAVKKQFSFDNLPEKSHTQYSQIDKDFLKKCIDTIRNNLDNPNFTVDILSEQMAFGRRSFFRKMKALTNMSPLEFILTFKLKHAAALLNEGLRVSEVAYSIGFENSQSFSLAFKKYFGVLPSEYKNANS